MDFQTALAFFYSNLEACRLCPRRCLVNRLRGELGFCEAGARLKIASFCLHTGEEPPVSGKRGSGAIFFAHCSMRCLYCQNYPISQLGYGNISTVEDLTAMMLSLQSQGAHNINLVTPTHFLPHVVQAVVAARSKGLRLPLVYNVSGYESVETIHMLEGIVQVYLVDMRYSSSTLASEYSQAPDYPHHNRLAVKEMLRQVGPLRCRSGLAVHGVIIRHLLLPGLLSETDAILRFISHRLSTAIPVSLMSQYFPAHRAHLVPALSRKITGQEYRRAIGLLERYQLRTGWVQDPDSVGVPVA